MLVTTYVNTEGTLGDKLAKEGNLLTQIEKLREDVSAKLKSEYRDVWLHSLKNEKGGGIYYQFLVIAQECAIEKLKKEHGNS